MNEVYLKLQSIIASNLPVLLADELLAAFFVLGPASVSRDFTGSAIIANNTHKSIVISDQRC